MRRTLGLAVGAALLLGACGGSSVTDKPAASTSTSQAAGPAVPPKGLAGPSCSVAPAGLVGEKLGLTVTQSAIARNENGTVCEYDKPDHSPAATIQLNASATAQSFAQGKAGFSTHGEQVSDVTGLGDEAYSATLAISTLVNHTLVVRKGGVEVLITSNAAPEALRALMESVLAAL